VAGEPPGIEVAGRFLLAQNRPNPFGRSTMIEYQVSKPGIVQLLVYNIAGQKVKTLVNGVQTVGKHSATWDGHDEFGNRVAGGVFIYRLSIANGSAVGKMNFTR